MNIEDIIFRGRRWDGVWAYGDLVRLSDGKICIDSHPFYFDVDPDTVGQYTGTKDNDGAKIFEGDIIIDKKGYLYKVMWIGNGMYGLRGLKQKKGSFYNFVGLPAWISEEARIVGNIHDALPKSNDERSETK